MVKAPFYTEKGSPAAPCELIRFRGLQFRASVDRKLEFGN